MIKLQKLLRCHRGATAVEFAMVVPIFLLMFAVVLEAGRIMWIKNTMQFAVEEVGRYAMVNSADIINDSATYIAIIEDTLGQSKVVGGFSSGVSFAVVYDNVTDPNAITLQTTASYTYSPLIGVLPAVSIPLSAMSKVPLNEEDD